MRAKPKNILISMVVLLCIPPMFWLSQLTQQDNRYEEMIERQFEKLRTVKHLNRQLDKDLLVLQSQLKAISKNAMTLSHNAKTLSHNATGNRSSALSTDLDLIYPMLMNTSDDARSDQGTQLHLPGIFHYLPHLVGKPRSLTPAYRLSKDRFGGKKEILIFQFKLCVFF
jgi:hypothetical protein